MLLHEAGDKLQGCELSSDFGFTVSILFLILRLHCSSASVLQDYLEVAASIEYGNPPASHTAYITPKCNLWINFRISLKGLIVP